MVLLDFKNIHHTSCAYIAFKHEKDAKTVHNGLVGVFGLHYTPNLRAIYLWLDDMRCDQFTLQKSTQTSCPRSAGSPPISQSSQKMVYKDPRMSVRDLSCSLSALFNI